MRMRTVRLDFAYAGDQDLKAIGDALDRLVRARNEAHYELQPSPRFASSVHAQQMIQRSEDALAVLDALEADPVRLQRAIGSFQ